MGLTRGEAHMDTLKKNLEQREKYEAFLIALEQANRLGKPV